MRLEIDRARNIRLQVRAEVNCLRSDLVSIIYQACQKAIYSYTDWHGHQPTRIAIPYRMFYMMMLGQKNHGYLIGIPSAFMGLELDIKQSGIPTCS